LPFMSLPYNIVGKATSQSSPGAMVPLLAVPKPGTSTSCSSSIVLADLLMTIPGNTPSFKGTPLSMAVHLEEKKSSHRLFRRQMGLTSLVHDTNVLPFMKLIKECIFIPQLIS
jgi:hypothetical protein